MYDDFGLQVLGLSNVYYLSLVIDHQKIKAIECSQKRILGF